MTYEHTEAWLAAVKARVHRLQRGRAGDAGAIEYLLSVVGQQAGAINMADATIARVEALRDAWGGEPCEITAACADSLDVALRGNGGTIQDG